MSVLPPGTLLQLMYLQERINVLSTSHFIEIGPGQGELTDRLLTAGWTGTVCDLDEKTVCFLKGKFAAEMAAGRLHVVLGSYLGLPGEDDADLVVSCMVMEHLSPEQERQFMQVSSRHLRKDGRMICLVPASPAHWGIEDEIAGHFRRYTRSGIRQLLETTGWRLERIVGLTFPVSNCLLPVSNFLVRRAESAKMTLCHLERTRQSGHRNVFFKTNFPPLLGLLLNETAMLPLHWLQKAFADCERAMVLLFEAVPLLKN
jgi:phospholipid N-methyltransferase